MSPRRITSPKTLEELCLTELLSYFGRECLFCSQVRKYQDRSLLLRRRCLDAQTLEKELESYLDTLPPLLNENVRQYITNEVLNTRAKTFLSHPEIYVGLLSIVLNKDIKSLEFNGDVQMSHESAIWPIIMKKCTGLKRFVMTQRMLSTQGINHVQPFLKQIISNCPTLTELILKDMVQSFETLRVIGKNCPVLKVLDIAGSSINCLDLAHLFVIIPRSRSISIDGLLNGSVPMVINSICSSLEVLNLSESNVKVRGAVFAIKTLPNLVSLGNFIYLAAAVKRLYGAKTKPNPPLKITQSFYYGSSHTKLKALSNTCPLMETLHIGSENLRRVASNCLQYKFLRSLTLENVEFDSFLENIPLLEHLVELQLSTSGVDVGILGRHCPNLEKLCLTGDPSKIPSRPPHCTPFAKLKELKMLCIASAECVGYIIKQAPDLKSIDVVRVKDLNDSIFAKWFQSNPFLQLETLMIRYAELTRATVDLLLEHCPKLTRLGELGGWDLRSWECRRLKDLIIRENYELHLVLYSRNADSIIIDILTENTSSEEDMALKNIVKSSARKR